MLLPPPVFILCRQKLHKTGDNERYTNWSSIIFYLGLSEEFRPTATCSQIVRWCEILICCPKNALLWLHETLAFSSISVMFAMSRWAASIEWWTFAYMAYRRVRHCMKYDELHITLLFIIYCTWRINSLPFYTARCTLVQSAVLRSHVVCLSVCL